MKKLFKFIIPTVVLLAAGILMSSCSKWDTPYASIDGEGYTVSVKFDANGGVFAGTKDVYVIDVFNLDNMKTNSEGMKVTPLLTPDDKNRIDSAFEVSRTGYFLAGWYTERTPRVNDAGEALDEYGVLTSVSGREQGYSYSGKWDFENDLFEVDPNGTYTSSENQMTLYAAWIPYFKYEFYGQTSDGTFELIETRELLELEVPEYNQSTGRMDMGKFPSVEGKTFSGAYLTEELDEKLSGIIPIEVDYERGVSSTETVKIYTTWLEGDWYEIYTAKQLFDNSKPNGNYVIKADLDFSGIVWSPTLAKTAFNGTIDGGGHKITGISVTQADTSQTSGGIFGTLGENAVIKDLTLENVEYIIESGSRMYGAKFGLLTGTLSEGATLENVSLGGTVKISDKCYPQDGYSIGLVSGNGESAGIDLSGITCETLTPESTAVTVDIDTETGNVSVTFAN